MLDQYVYAKHYLAMAPTTSPVCAKCAAVKGSSKYSCCARGGSWFKSCGSNGDFDHTWAEGLQACTNVKNLFSDKEELQLVLLNRTTTSQLLKTFQVEGRFYSSISITRHTPTTNSKSFDQLSCIIVSVTLVLIIAT